MGVNPALLQTCYDWGQPKAISGKAREVISGGQLVFISGATGLVSSGANSFDPATDIAFAAGASGLDFTGIAAHTAESGADLTVFLDGAHLITCIAAVSAARTVVATDGNSVEDGTAAGTVVGRSLTAAASGGYALINLRGN